jgi:hypothetical protein
MRGTLLAVALILSGVSAASGQNVDIVIHGLSDLNLGVWDGRSSLTATTSFCVGARPKRSHEIRIDSPRGGFEMRDGAARLSYTVAYNDGRSWRDVNAGETLSGLDSSPLNPCEKGRKSTQELRVTVSQDALAAAPAGRYADTLRLTVRPE